MQKQTESNLIDHESQLKHHAWQLNHAESQLTLTETTRREVFQEIRDLKTEITRLTTTNECLQKEKDRFIVSATMHLKACARGELALIEFALYSQMKLDAKTEKIGVLEAKVESMRERLATSNCQTDTASRQLE